MGDSNEGTSIPKSLRHKQILDAAAENPDATLEELAAEIPSATTDLVEYVLGEYGDPARTDTADVATDERGTAPEDTMTEDTDGSPDDEPTTTSDATKDATEAAGPTVTGAPTAHNDHDEHEVPPLEDLTAKQRETLRLIREQPEATQAELAERLDVSAPTISTRVNSIEGFEWRDRQAFVANVFDEPAPTTNSHATPSQSATDGGLEQHSTPDLEALTERVTELEAQLEAETAESTPRPFDDPELLHKIVHACMDSPNITEDEELRMLQALLAPATMANDN